MTAVGSVSKKEVALDRSFRQQYGSHIAQMVNAGVQWYPCPCFLGQALPAACNSICCNVWQCFLSSGTRCLCNGCTVKQCTASARQ